MQSLQRPQRPQRPSDRVRLSASSDYDAIPDIDRVRRNNDLRLQGRWEAIFEKYDRDFSEVADVIDLRTGQIVVDNGHLRNMRNERDIGTGGSRRAVRHTTHTTVTMSESGYPPESDFAVTAPRVQFFLHTIFKDSV